MSALPEILPGRCEPLGSHARDGGVNFAVFSQSAQRMELCIFDSNGNSELRRYDLFGPDDHCFHAFLPGCGPGLVYGLRAYGPYEPHVGLRFNPNKLLLDPYAREVVGRFTWRPEHFGYTQGHPDGPLSFDARDNAADALKARVTTASRPAPGWFNAPRHARDKVVLYEMHVKGFSKQNPEVDPAMQGTYAGLAHPASIAYFKRLGVTTLSLLPVHFSVDEEALARRGLSNYWGYNTLGFFALDPRWSMYPDHPSAAAAEFRSMVHTLHEHGIEVVLDVVYNHTAEGNEYGPTLSFRGLDNVNWYRLVATDPSAYENLTGCGNALRVAHPRVTQFVLDSLRYWVYEMGVDGFRFDLAPVLGRTDQGFEADAPFFTALRQDPVLARVHLIAEPWDAGHNGYHVGRFPGRFLDWNDRFRDAARGYWLQQGVDCGEFARRFTASSDLFQHGTRRPTASVNFLAVHDGYTLSDMVSYRHKHNFANGEDNRDGRDGELSVNLGVEGDSDNPDIVEMRLRLRRAMLATVLLAQGTPMLCAGDEMGRSQGGNNNAYCQDNVLTWLDWSRADQALIGYVGALNALRKAEPLLHSDAWFTQQLAQQGGPHRTWRRPDGQDMQTPDWHDTSRIAFACEMGYAAPETLDRLGSKRLMLLFNPEAYPKVFALSAGRWHLAIDSSQSLTAGSCVQTALCVPGSSVLVLRDVETGFIRSKNHDQS